MKKNIILIMVLVFGLFVGGVDAQEITSLSSFSGLYFGSSVGVVSQTAYRKDLDGFLKKNSDWSTIGTGVNGGARIGCDIQCDNAVIGIVTSCSTVNLDQILRDYPKTDTSKFVKDNLQWCSTIRGRTGVVISNSLLYVTGGACFGRFKTTWKDEIAKFFSKKPRWGWVGGFGLEHKLRGGISFGVEFLYMQFANKDRLFTNDNPTTYRFGYSDAMMSGCVFLNYSPI